MPRAIRGNRGTGSGVIPRSYGGTGVTTASAALAVLGGVPSSKVNQPNGVLGLNADGIVDAQYALAIPVPRIIGPAEIATATTSVYSITNYDAFTVYTVKPISGQVSIIKDRITYQSPAAEGSAGFNVNGVVVPVTVSGTAINRPGIVTYTTAQAVVNTPFVVRLDDPDGVTASTEVTWLPTVNGVQDAAIVNQGVTLSYTPTVVGTLKFTAQYRDGALNPNTATGQDLPVAAVVTSNQIGKIVLTQYSVNVGTSVTAILTDLDGPAVGDVAWAVNGTALPDIGMQATYTPATSGSYVLTASYKDGASNIESVTAGVLTAIATTGTPGTLKLSTYTTSINSPVTAEVIDANDVTGNVTWKVNNITMVRSGLQYTYTPPAAGTYTIQAQYTDVLNTTETPSAVLEVIAAGNTPGIIKVSNTSLLINEQLDAWIDDPDTVQGLVTWKINGTVVTGNGSTMSHIPKAIGDLNITASYSDMAANAETPAVKVSVTSIPNTVGTITIPASATANQKVTVVLNDADIVTGDVVWSVVGGGVFTGTGTNVELTCPTPNITTKVTVTALYKDQYGRDSTASGTVTVSPATANPGSISIPTNAAAGEIVPIKLVDADIVTGDVIWSSVGGDVSGTTVDAALTCPSGATSTTVTVKADYYDQYGILSSASGKITVAAQTSNPGSIVMVANAAAGETITVSLKDADVPTGDIIWTATPSGNFEGTGTDVNLICPSGISPASITVKAEYNDQFGRPSSATGLVKVAALALNPNSLDMSTTAAAAEVLTISIIDLDVPTGVVKWSVTGGGSFIDPIDGPTVSFKAPSPSASTKVTITASYLDQYGRASTATGVTTVSAAPLNPNSIVIATTATAGGVIPVQLVDQDMLPGTPVQWVSTAGTVAGLDENAELTCPIPTGTTATKVTVTASYIDQYGRKNTVTGSTTVSPLPIGANTLSLPGNVTAGSVVPILLIDSDVPVDPVIWTTVPAYDITGDATGATLTCPSPIVATKITVNASYKDQYGRQSTATGFTTVAAVALNPNSIQMASTALAGETIDLLLVDLDIPNGATVKWVATGGGIISGTTESATMLCPIPTASTKVTVTATYSDQYGRASTATGFTTVAAAPLNPNSIQVASTALSGETLQVKLIDLDTPAGTPVGWVASAGSISGTDENAVLVCPRPIASTKVTITATYTDQWKRSNKVLGYTTVAMTPLSVGVLEMPKTAASGETITMHLNDPEATAPFTWTKSVTTGTMSAAGTDGTLILPSVTVITPVTVTVAYKDTLGRSMSAKAAVEVAAAPNTDGIISLPTTAKAGETITGTLTDADGISGTVTWSRVPTTGNTFTISGTSVTLKCPALTTPSTVTVTAKYTDLLKRPTTTSTVVNVAAMTQTLGTITFDPVAPQAGDTVSVTVYDDDGIPGGVSWSKSGGGTLVGASATASTLTNVGKTIQFIAPIGDVSSVVSFRANYVDNFNRASIANGSVTVASRANTLGSLDLPAEVYQNSKTNVTVSDPDNIVGSVVWTAPGATIAGTTNMAVLTIPKTMTSGTILVTAKYTDGLGRTGQIASKSTNVLPAANTPGVLTIPGPIVAGSPAVTMTIADPDVTTNASVTWTKSPIASGTITGTTMMSSQLTIPKTTPTGQMTITGTYTDALGRTGQTATATVDIIGAPNAAGTVSFGLGTARTIVTTAAYGSSVYVKLADLDTVTGSVRMVHTLVSPTGVSSTISDLTITAAAAIAWFKSDSPTHRGTNTVSYTYKDGLGITSTVSGDIIIT